MNNHLKETMRTLIIPLSILLIISAFFSFYNLKSAPPGLYPDEAMDGTNALQVIAGAGPQVFFPQNGGREGLFMDIQAVALVVFGQREPWVLRSVSGIFGILVVLGIFLFVREFLLAVEQKASALMARRATYIAFVAAFFAATSFWLIDFSRIGFRAIMAPAFLVWALWALIKAWRGTTGWRRYAYAIAGGVIYGLGMYSYIAYRVTPLLIVVLFLLFYKTYETARKKTKVIFGIFVLAAFMTALPLAMYFIGHPADFFGRTSEISIFSSASSWQGELMGNIGKTAGMLIFSGDMNWRHNIAGAPELYWPIAVFFCIGILAGTASVISWRVKKKIGLWQGFDMFFVFMCVWLVCAFAPVVFSNEGIPHALRSILMIPAAFSIAGIGAYAVYRFVRRYISVRVVSACGAVLGVGLLLHAYGTYFIVWAQNPAVADAFNARSVAIARTIQNIPHSIPVYVVAHESGVDVDGIPVSAQTVMFMTDTYDTALQQQKNIHYVTEADEKNIPADAVVFYLQEEGN